jgi:peptide/nickel transport system substrate-binding protein/oligopeptide transport system substrate-binding protein
VAYSADPVSLDPARAVDVVGGNAVALVFEGLVVFDADGRLAPGIASRWGASEGGRVWRFVLDPGARDSEGRTIGATEVLASFRRLLDPGTGSPRSWVLERVRGAREFRDGRADSIAGLSVAGDTVVVELDAPSPSFPALLAMPNAAILPEGEDASGRVATGPWALVEHVRDAHLLLRRNPHWHGTKPSFDELQVRILPEDFTRVAEFDVGHLDVLEVPASESARFRADPRLAARLHRQVVLAVEYVGLNNEDPVLRDPRVRKALNLAVNVELLLERVLDGRGVRALGAIPPGLPGGGRGEPFAYDPASARRLLAECAIPPGWELELWQRPSPLASQVLEAVQADLAAVGVKAVLRVRDWSALKASIDRGETPAFYANWFADYPDPENFLVPLFHSANIGGGGNRARFRDPAVDAALEAMERETDPAARAERCAEIDRRVHDACPWIYLWHPVSEVCVSERVEGYRPSVVPTAQRWLDVRPAAKAASP